MNIIVTKKNIDVINEAVSTLIEKYWNEGYFGKALRTAMIVYGATKEDIDILDNHNDSIDAICELIKKYVWDREDNKEKENPYLADGVHATKEIDQLLQSGIISAGTINSMFQSEVFLNTIREVDAFRDYSKELAEECYTMSIGDAMDYFNERYNFFKNRAGNIYYEYGWTLDKIIAFKAIRVRTKDGNYKWSVVLPNPIRIL